MSKDDVLLEKWGGDVKASKKILALDLATKMGVYDGTNAELVVFTPENRVRDFYKWLKARTTDNHYDVVVFENAFRQPGKAAEVFQQFKTICILVCDEVGAELTSEVPTTIKKVFTGNGRADKQEIIDKVLDMGIWLPYSVPSKGKNKGVKLYDDNAADAVAIHETYRSKYE